MLEVSHGDGRGLTTLQAFWIANTCCTYFSIVPCASGQNYHLGSCYPSAPPT